MGTDSLNLFMKYLINLIGHLNSFQYSRMSDYDNRNDERNYGNTGMTNNGRND